VAAQASSVRDATAGKSFTASSQIVSRGSRDFYSDKASGEEPGYTQREFPELCESLSMWDDARYATTRAAVRGKRVVRIIVPAAATAHDVAVHSTPNAEHHVDVWAAPSRLLSMARNVLPDRAQRR
jgi:hypothetical protein